MCVRGNYYMALDHECCRAVRKAAQKNQCNRARYSAGKRVRPPVGGKEAVVDRVAGIVDRAVGMVDRAAGIVDRAVDIADRAADIADR